MPSFTRATVTAVAQLSTLGRGVNRCKVAPRVHERQGGSLVIEAITAASRGHTHPTSVTDLASIVLGTYLPRPWVTFVALCSLWSFLVQYCLRKGYPVSFPLVCNTADDAG